MKTLREAARADELNEKVKMNEDPSDFPEIFKKSSGSKIIQWFEKDVVGSAMENDSPLEAYPYVCIRLSINKMASRAVLQRCKAR